MKDIITVFTVLTLGLLATTVSAQATTKSPVAVDCSGNDANGKQLCTALRDKFAGSPRYRLVDGYGTGYAWRVHLVSLDVADDNVQSAVSYTFTIQDKTTELFMDSGVMVCGQNKVQWCSNTVMADLDKIVDDVLKSQQK